MTHYFIRLFFAVLITGTLAACSDDAKLPALDANSTILAFGDSLRQL